MLNRASPSDQLAYSTVRIECELSDGKHVTGTGFYYAFGLDSIGNMPAIVTNRHVVKDAVRGTIRVHLGDENENPLEGQNYWITFETFEAKWIVHPRPEIDLCVLPMAPVHALLRKNGVNPFFIALHDELIASEAFLNELHSIEDIVMVGYPDGLWDSHNNMPIVRRGITATHPGLRYNGRDEFLIDAACFPGSSGSPVFLYNPSGYVDSTGTFIVDRRIKLLGVLYAGPQHPATGEIEVIEVPIVAKPVAVSMIPNNLGNVLRAYLMLAFEAILRKHDEEFDESEVK